MNRFLIVALSTFLMIFSYGCERNSELLDCAGNDQAPVTLVTGPTTAAVNQEIDLEVSFGVVNGCGRFGKFEQVNAGNTITISVLASYIGCVCTMNAPIIKSNYKFIATHPGTYHLRFEQTQGNYLVHTVVVQ